MNTNKNENSDQQISPVNLNLSAESGCDSSVCYCRQNFMPKVPCREQESCEEESSSKEVLSEEDSSWKEESSYDVSVSYFGHHLISKESCDQEETSGEKSSSEEDGSLCYCCEKLTCKLSRSSEDDSSSKRESSYCGESSGIDSSSKDELSQDRSECYCAHNLKHKESRNREEPSAEDATWEKDSSCDDPNTDEESHVVFEGFFIQCPGIKPENWKHVHESSSRLSSCENLNEEEYVLPDKPSIGFEGDSYPYSGPEFAFSGSEEESDSSDNGDPSSSSKDSKYSSVEESMNLPLYVSNTEDKEDSLQKLRRQELFYGKPMFSSTPKEGVLLKPDIIYEYLEKKLMDLSLDNNR
ncbi:hypothetical protein GWI33_007841 [Rhynchophorus ferrugineus]|uniref:Uncharacterized protein n=1 Tax=Rhynchophorus ferrugineus TaxID=354439 RepID=A0A834MHZ7_RHYFE|nr:hypothetical protein GWI33_007841 [Rhynchophorus ferrugineus]